MTKIVKSSGATHEEIAGRDIGGTAKSGGARNLKGCNCRRGKCSLAQRIKSNGAAHKKTASRDIGGTAKSGGARNRKSSDSGCC